LVLFGLAAALLPAQIPRIGQIELYGLRKVPAEKVGSVLRLKEGDPLPPSKGDVEDRLEKIDGVVLARLEAVCCEQGNAILFVGIEEKGAPHFAFRSLPAGGALLPEAVVADYRRFVEAVARAARRGSTAEDLTQGHSLMADPSARALQQRFAAYAAERPDVLREVLRNSSDDEHRAMAAMILGYAPDKQKVVDDLQYGMQDPDEAVRANAMRSLTAIAVLARLDPARQIRISPTWFVEMLNSIVLSDRTRAATALVTLTEKDGEEALEQIRARALPAVAEMARWNSLRYALPAFLLAGRAAGLSETEIHQAWQSGGREEVIAGALGGPGKR
jgi:hypothetical protein